MSKENKNPPPLPPQGQASEGQPPAAQASQASEPGTEPAGTPEKIGQEAAPSGWTKAGSFKDGENFDRGRVEPTTQSDLDKRANAELRPSHGDPMNDRYLIETPNRLRRFTSAGILFIDGVAYTGSEKTASICRGLRYKVIDRKKPAAAKTAKSGGES